MGKKLIVLCSELTHEWIKKGEVVPNYYNPNGLFSHIDFLIQEKDLVQQHQLQYLSGSAEIRIFRYKVGFINFLFLTISNTFYSKIWALKYLGFLSRTFTYDVIRCYGAEANLILAMYIKTLQKKRVPVVASIHVNYDVSRNFYQNSLLTFLRHKTLERIRRKYLPLVDQIWPVYSTIIPYLTRRHLSNYRVVYNVPNSSIRVKKEWQIKNRIRVICVGRLIPEKSPQPIIEAVARNSACYLDIVGDGPLRGYLEHQIATLGVASRIKIISAINNDELCKSLKNYDLGLLYTTYLEFSKVMIEMILTGLPLVINSFPNINVAELSDLPISFVDGDAESYYRIIERLSASESIRKQIGMSLTTLAWPKWSSLAAEAEHSNAYLQVIGS